jgi:hypothetical protein
MEKFITTYVDKLLSFRNGAKNLHFSAIGHSEHIVLDQLTDSLDENLDTIAEVLQGVYDTTFKRGENSPIETYKVTNSKKFIADVIKTTEDFYAKLQGKTEYIGIRSVIENFISELQRYNYLLILCLRGEMKESITGISMNESVPYVKDEKTQNIRFKNKDFMIETLCKAKGSEECLNERDYTLDVNKMYHKYGEKGLKKLAGAIEEVKIENKIKDAVKEIVNESVDATIKKLTRKKK